MTKSIPLEDTHPPFADKYDPRKSEPRGDRKPNTLTRRKIFKHAGKGIAPGEFSCALGRTAAVGLWNRTTARIVVSLCQIPGRRGSVQSSTINCLSERSTALELRRLKGSFVRSQGKCSSLEWVACSGRTRRYTSLMRAAA